MCPDREHSVKMLAFPFLAAGAPAFSHKKTCAEAQVSIFLFQTIAFLIASSRSSYSSNAPS